MSSPDGSPHHEQVRIMLRPVGSGLPLGFFSFGIGMLLLGCSALGFIPEAEVRDIGVLLIAFVFPLELLATVFAFLARDTLGATTLGLFTTSWAALGWSDLRATPGQTSSALGIYLFGFATAALLLALLSLAAKPFFSAVLAVAVSRMVFSGVYEVGGSKTWLEISGGLGIALAALALYGGTALALEDAAQRERLPLFRRGKAVEAFEGYEAQLDRLEAEPGVRQAL